MSRLTVKTEFALLHRSKLALLLRSKSGKTLIKIRQLSYKIKELEFRRIAASASRAAANRNWAYAARTYSRAIALKPEAPWIWVQYGHALKESGSLEEAAHAYQMALSRNETDEETYYHLAELLRKLGRDKDVDYVLRRVIELYRSGRNHGEETGFIMLNRAKAEAALGGNAKYSTDQFEAALKNYPSSDGLVQYGHVLKDWGRHIEAEAQYRKALAVAPRNADTYLHLGHCLKLQGRIRDAARAYKVAFNLSTVSRDAVHGYARVELEALGESTATHIEVPNDVQEHTQIGSLRHLIDSQNWQALLEQLEIFPDGDKPAGIAEFTAQILMLIGDDQAAYRILEGLASSALASELTFLIMARDREANGDLETAGDLYGKALAASMRYGEPFDALVRLNKYEHVFSILEPCVFPRSCHPSPSQDKVVVPASGRTPGILLPGILARSVRSEILARADDLEEKGYHAQAKLFRIDAELIPQSDNL